MARHVGYFLREPRLGAVKRRLGAEIGHVAAWQFYRRTVRHVLPPLNRDPRWQFWLAATPDDWAGVSRFWPDRCATLPQGRGDIGRRMLRAFRAMPPGPAVIVGSDIPSLAPGHIEEAFRLLGRNDVVFGPATDGGYWLIGLAAHARMLDPFRNVAWSTPSALDDTRANLAPSIRVGLCATLDDVDDAARYHLSQAMAVHSISMSNSIGQDAMATKVRAGGSLGK